jgi:type III restriction enzyme
LEPNEFFSDVSSDVTRVISNATWAEIRTAYASGIGLREVGRNMGIPDGTVLARAKREGWTREIQKRKGARKARGFCARCHSRRSCSRDISGAQPAAPRRAKELLTCKAASKQTPWNFLYVPEGVFQKFSGDALSELETVCATHCADLLAERVDAQFTLPLGEVGAADVNLTEFISTECFDALPPRYQKGVEQAVSLFRHLEHKTGVSFAPPFTALLGALDEAARGLMIDRLAQDVPQDATQLDVFLEADVSSLAGKEADTIKFYARNLRGTIVDRKGTMPIGVLRWSLTYARSPRPSFGPIFDSIKARFSKIASKDFIKQIEHINAFRNTYVAHQEQPLEDVEQARAALKEWSVGLYDIWKAHH